MASRRGGNSGNDGNSNNSHGNNSDRNRENNSPETAAEKFDRVVEGGYKNEPVNLGSTESVQGYYSSRESSGNGVLGVEGYSAGSTNAEVRGAAYAEDGTAYAGFNSTVSTGSVSASGSGYGRADFRIDNPYSGDGDGALNVGAEAEIKSEVSAGPVSANATARAGIGINATSGKTQAGVDASVGAEAKIGGGGNEIGVGVGVGAGIGGEIVHGEDSDGDGRGEIGFSLNLVKGVGGSVGVRFEPETVAEEVQGWFGGNKPAKNSKEHSDPFSCHDRFSAALEMPEIKSAYARLESFL